MAIPHLSPGQVSAFTVHFDGLARTFIAEALISAAFDFTKEKEYQIPNKYFGIWDTGATNSCITKKVIDQCGLKPIGMTKVHTVGGTKESELFLVNIGLPNKVGIPNIKVSEGNIEGADILIGMDIIRMGDFAITHKGGKTKFSFRIPPVEYIDFVEQIESEKGSPIKRTDQKIGRNAPCPCGSGKKYKKCCGI